MILFISDWLRYPSAAPDYTTKNKSFIRYAGLLKSMGIDNNAFCLALHDQSLIGVDPHSEDLTQDQIVAISVECKINPWYFIREVARAPALSGSEPTMFRANRFTISLFWLFFNHITSLGIAPRQTGKSFSTDMLMTLLLRISLENTNINLLTKDDDLRVKNVTRLKDIAEELPKYLNLKIKGDTNNTEKITVNRLGNTYTTAVAQSSPKAALNTGRGSTFAINHIDELPFIKNIDITLPALLAASGAARDSASAAGEPYGNIFTTTAGYLNSKEGAYVYKEIYLKAMPWTEKLYDASDEDTLKDMVRKNSPGKKLIVLLEFNHRQLGYTDEWLRGKIEDAMAEGDAVLADFLNIWIEGSSSSPIPKKLLKILSDSTVNEPYIDIANSGYATRWYVPAGEIYGKVKDRETIISFDTSDAVGKDDIAMTVRDVRTGATIAAGQYNETNLITFSEWLVDWLIEYPKMTMIIERRSSGIAIIDNLLKILPAKGIDPFRRIFNWVVDDAIEYPNRISETINTPMNRRHPAVYIRYRKYFGFATSGSGKTSREGLYGNSLLSSIKYTGYKARDKNLINQISGLTVKNGRIDHKTGSHDDLVISWALSYWFLTTARNKELYGINNNIVLSTIINTDMVNDGTNDKMIKQSTQLAIKEKIDSMLEVLRKENNPVLARQLTIKIKHMYKDIDTNYVKSFNIDNVLESIELDKKKNQSYY